MTREPEGCGLTSLRPEGRSSNSDARRSEAIRIASSATTEGRLDSAKFALRSRNVRKEAGCRLSGQSLRASHCRRKSVGAKRPFRWEPPRNEKRPRQNVPCLPRPRILSRRGRALLARLPSRPIPADVLVPRLAGEPAILSSPILREALPWLRLPVGLDKLSTPYRDREGVQALLPEESLNSAVMFFGDGSFSQSRVVESSSVAR